MAEEYAFSTDNLETLAAYRETRTAAREFGARLAADREALGENVGAYVRRGVWGSRDTIYALEPDVRHVMVERGLPRHSSMPSRTGGYRMSSPALFEHDGTLWACYEGKPGGPFDTDDGPCTWTPRKLSEFHAAREAAEAADQTAKAVA